MFWWIILDRRSLLGLLDILNRHSIPEVCINYGITVRFRETLSLRDVGKVCVCIVGRGRGRPAVLASTLASPLYPLCSVALSLLILWTFGFFVLLSSASYMCLYSPDNQNGPFIFNYILYLIYFFRILEPIFILPIRHLCPKPHVTN